MTTFSIYQSFNGGMFNLTRRINLTAREAAEQLAALVEEEIELQKIYSNRAEYEIRPDPIRGDEE